MTRPLPPRPGADTALAVLEWLRNPPSTVPDAMASEQREARKRNGVGTYGFRDMWIAGVDAAIREFHP